MLKKSYTGFILWVVVYMAAILLIPALPTDDAGLLLRMICGMSAIAIVALMVMIYISEKIFWFNGVTYEEAVAAGSDRRKAYALRNLLRFGWFTAAYLILAVAGQIIGWNIWIDIVVFTVGIIAVAVSTNGIKL